MRLRALAGAYAGQVRDYSTATGLAALRSGMAEPIDAMPRVIQTATTTETKPREVAKPPARSTRRLK